MYGDIIHGHTPERRIAALLYTLIRKKVTALPFNFDYMDMQDIIRPYLAKEILLIRLDEADQVHSEERKKVLRQNLEAVELDIANHPV